MRLIRCAACAALFTMAPAQAQATIPVKSAATAPATTLAHQPNVVGAELGSYMGVGVYAMHALDPHVSVGAFYGRLPIDLDNDKLTINSFGLRARYHWRGYAPRGAYVFTDLAYIDASFSRSAQETGRRSEKLSHGLFPSAGVGYQTRGRVVSWDFGGGIGREVHFEADYGGGNHSSATFAGNLYIGLSFGL